MDECHSTRIRSGQFGGEFADSSAGGKSVPGLHHHHLNPVLRSPKASPTVHVVLVLLGDDVSE